MKKMIWFTGLPSSGKTTLAKELIRIIPEKMVFLDGDDVRKNLSLDLGYSNRDRNKQLDRLYGVGTLILDSDIIPMICTNSAPTERMKNIFIVYVKCNIDECIKRDVKGLYKKAIKGEIKNLPGIDLKYVPPKNPDIILETDKYNIDECVNKLIEKLEEEDVI